MRCERLYVRHVIEAVNRNPSLFAQLLDRRQVLRIGDSATENRKHNGASHYDALLMRIKKGVTA